MSEMERDLLSRVQQDDPLGLRLRRAREAAGISIADVAAKMKVPLSVVEAIERGDWSRLGGDVYVRGYLHSYARIVDMPSVVVERAVSDAAGAPPPLRSTSHVSHTRYLIDRYALRAVYVVLTASIVLPAIWLATEDRLQGSTLGLRSLDAPVLPVPAAVPPAGTESAAAQTALPPSTATDELVGPPAPSADDMPVVASLAPFYPTREPAAAPAIEAPVVDDGWLLRFTGDSWVEILDADGNRLEYGLIRAGTERRFAEGRVARVALGNAGAVEVLRAGRPVVLAPFQRANVARFTVSSGGELTPATN